MSKEQRFLTFDIDLDQIAAISASLEANKHQVRAAHARAVSRTLTTMQKLSRKAIQDEIGAKSAKVLQKRVMGYRMKALNTMSDKQMKMWFGLNDVAAHVLKGTMSKLPEGARFTSQAVGSHSFRRGFIADKDGKKYLFDREGSGRGAYKVARIELPESVQLRIEDDVMSDLPDIYFHHFEVDLKGRVKTGLNKNGVERTRSR